MKRSATTQSSISPPPGKKKVTSTTTASAISGFFAPASQKPPSVFKIIDETMVAGYFKQAKQPPRLRKGSNGPSKAGAVVASSSKTSVTVAKSADSTVVTDSKVTVTAETISNGASSSKDLRIVAFDLDSTLVNTKSGNKFAKDAGDWVWWNTCVPKKLKQLHEDGVRLVIFTNQNGVKLKSGKSDKRLDEYKGRVTEVCTALDLPVMSYAATEKDKFRKPRTGMFQELLADLGDDAINLDIGNSIFVGDASGRKGDFSASDRQFAENVGLKFMTPEEFFLGKPEEPYTLPIDPSAYLPSAAGSSKASTPVFTKNSPLELVLLVGSPASGKSTFYFNYLEPLDYERINQDILKTREKCIKTANGHLGEGTSVAIDATNPDTDVRGLWKAVADKHKAAFRCVYLTTPQNLCEHNNCYRAFGTNSNPESREALPGMAFNFFKKRFQEPTMKEGFVDITKVDFQFRGDQKQEDEWKKHWTS